MNGGTREGCYLAKRKGKLVPGWGRKKKKSPDVVNHPPHYTEHPSGIECIQVTEHMNFNLGNVVKYLWRAGAKGKLCEDLKKARWYLDREIARIEKVTGPPPSL